MIYKVSIPVIVHVVTDVEAENEQEAQDKANKLNFWLVDGYGHGGASLYPEDEDMTAIAECPDYQKMTISSPKE